MKKVLFIAYFFPPIGGGGVQRSLKFVKYLPSFGFMPTVLTTAGAGGGRWAPPDESLLRHVPEEIKVHRISGLPPSDGGGSRWERRLRELFFLQNRFASAWTDSVIREGTRICSEERPDCIFVTMSPFSGATAASALARRFKIPWVADLRDPWALDELLIYPTGLHHAAVCRRMRRSLADASVIIMNTPEAAAALLRAFPEFRKKRVVSITNGYDAADFEGLQHRPDPGTFKIVHTGSLHTDFAFRWPKRQRISNLLGGAARGVDFSTRSHLYLLRALERWAPEASRSGMRIRLMLVGNLTPADKQAVADSPAREFVEIPGWLRSHAEIMQAQVDAHLLFLPMHKLPDNQRARIVPGKTYEYMASKVPVLAAVPPGDARDFLEGSGAGRFCRPDDMDGMIHHLEKRLQECRVTETPPPTNASYIERFERRRLTEQLASELHAVCA